MVQVKGKEKEMFHFFPTEHHHVWVNLVTFRAGMENVTAEEP